MNVLLYCKLVSILQYAILTTDLYVRPCSPSSTAVELSSQNTLPSGVVYLVMVSMSQLTHLAAILVPMLRSNTLGEPPCCMWPE